MKPYQHHDEYHDIGKAKPHPKRPNKVTFPSMSKPVEPREKRSRPTRSVRRALRRQDRLDRIANR